MSPEQRREAARRLANDEFVALVMDDIERAALNRGVGAAATDHDTRAAAMAEVRAIRALRARISGEAGDGQPAHKGAVA